MNRYVALTVVFLIIFSESASGHEARTQGFPSNFGQRAMDHVMALVRLGPRPAGSSAERDAAAYIRKRFNEMGLPAKIEPFEFETFVVSTATVSVGTAKATPSMIGFNPYQGKLSLEGRPLLVRPDVGSDDLGRLQLTDGLVITADPAPFFALMFGRPRAIIYLEPGDYESLTASPCSLATLRVVGNAGKCVSANVVATVGSTDPDAEEIVVSAHYESYRQSPGADDNGSGTGVLIELARYFATRRIDPHLRLRFVAFGAEELGVVGSRSYLNAHREELARCALLINLDQVGGPKGPYVEMTGGVSGVQDTTVENRFPADLQNCAWEAMDGQWRLVDPRVVELFMVSNRPPWLKDLIAESAAAIHCELIPTGNMGGDQQVFTQAGIVATGIGTSGNTYHSSEDTPGQVVVGQMAIAGRLAVEIALRVMEKLCRADGNTE
jgi:hypothetical protein